MTFHVRGIPAYSQQYYATDFDKNTAIFAFRNARKLLANHNLSQWAIGPDNGEVSPGVAVQSDEDILSLVI